MEELKPCPFCGGEARIHKDEYCVVMVFYEVYCTNCGNTNAQVGTEEKAIEAWNRRTP